MVTLGLSVGLTLLGLEMSNLNENLVRIFLAGDCMLGRGVDAICKYSCHPRLYEGYCTSALDYVKLAEQQSGSIPRVVQPDYFWKGALPVLDLYHPHARIINLETSVTERNSFAREKGIHYHMHPKNLQILKAAAIDAVCLANNHVADFGPEGIVDTVQALDRAGVKFAGAGSCAPEAQACARIPINLPESMDPSHILLYSICHTSSGVPPHWKATTSPGVYMTDFTSQSVQDLALRISKDRNHSTNDVVVLSIHWGGNWGYDIDPSFTQYAHDVIDNAGVDVVFGHSSHHPQPIEIYKNKLIIYGAGDFINDYEGIRDSGATGEGMDAYRGDLTLMYLLDVNPVSGHLHTLHLVPRKICHLRVEEPSAEEVTWMFSTLSAQFAKRGHRLERGWDSESFVLDVYGT